MARFWISLALIGWAVQAHRPSSGVIAGRVTDEFGDPVIDARVSVELAAVGALRSRSPGWSTTDDHGEYRIAALAPGDYIVAVDRLDGYVVYSVSGPVTISSGRPQPETIYHPGTSVRAEARPVTVTAGEERPQIDFAVRAQPPVLPPLAAMRIAQAGARPKDPDATAALRGRVSTIDGRAVPRAHVELVPDVDLTQSAVTVADADGTFEFRNLLPGRFRVLARKSGFAELEPNPGDAASPASARTVELMRQETRERVDLALARWGSVSGTIVDEAGAPVRGAGLQLLQIRYSRGRRRLGGGGVARLTDDRGRYRMFAVPPGQYVVSAAVGGAATADLSGYARAYYPGTSNAANAQFVSIGRSQELTGVDMALSRTPTARITGQVINAAGVPSNPGSLTLIEAANSGSIVSVPSGARITGEGAFEFPNVPPGQYVIRADRGRRNATEGEFGTIVVAVDGSDVTGLTLKTSSGSTITGRIVFDAFNGTLPPSPAALELAPMPIDYDLAPANIASAEIRADWSFEVRGINGPRRLQLLRVPAGWMLKEIRVRGVDATDQPIAFGRPDQSLAGVEVVLTDRVSSVAGSVVDDQRRASPGAHVMVFSTDRSRWYEASRFMRKTVAAADGTFSTSGLPFGSYYVAALARLPFATDEEWQDPAFLESLARGASSVTIREGETQPMTLRLTN